MQTLYSNTRKHFRACRLQRRPIKFVSGEMLYEACRILRLSRSSLHYRSKKDDTSVRAHLERLSQEHPTEGFWKCYDRLRNAGVTINHKRLHRVLLLADRGYKVNRKRLRRLMRLQGWQTIYPAPRTNREDSS